MSRPANDTTGTPDGAGMFRELLAIHALLRRDLQTVRRLADEARSSVSPDAILAELRDLETNSPLWRLKFGCLYYCRFVHGHHTLEDAAVFPMVRKHDPALNAMVDRLEADHLKVHHITERIAVAANQIATDGSLEPWSQLVEALTEMEEHLLAHLALEEQALGPLLGTWDHWPRE